MGARIKKVIIFAPFWGQAGHVGCHRIDRFVRWLSEDGYSIIIIKAGASDGERLQPWGKEITVRDRMGLHPDAAQGAVYAVSPRKPNNYRRALAYWLFNPDPTIVWARAAAGHPAVLQAMENAAFILSSSPPESAHVGAWMLSRRMRVPHIVDMRDGWLDEPLKPLLRSSRLRRWLEGRMEAKILRDAKAVQVTSEVWQELLLQRLPDLSGKVRVLTNCYPQHMPEPLPRKQKGSDEEMVLIYAGRFIDSDTRRTPDILLKSLIQSLSFQPSKGVIQLVGPLSDFELNIIESFKLRFQKFGWRIECSGALPRNKLLELLPQADSLLLMSTSYAGIPAKLFEYIPTKLPIFAVTEKESAVWRICDSLPQVTLCEIGKSSEIDFIKSINIARRASIVPDFFLEKEIKNIFFNILI